MWCLTFLIFHIFCYAIASKDILNRINSAEGYFFKDKEVCGSASDIARSFFYRPQYIPMIIAYRKKSERCIRDDTSIFQELINYLVDYISEFACMSIICDEQTQRKISCENFIVITENAETLQDNMDLIPREYFNYAGRIIIIVKNDKVIGEDKLKNIQDIMNFCWTLRMINIIVVAHISGKVSLYTFYPYSDENCDSSELVQMNTWKNGQFEMDIDLYPLKTMNLYGCLLKVTAVPRHPHVILKKSSNGTLDIEGVEGNLVKTLAHLLNFTFEVIQPKDEVVWGRWNGTKWTGATGDLVYNRASLGIGAYYPSLMRFGTLDISFGYDTVKLVWAIPLLEKDPSALKLLLPFQGFIWISTILTIVFLIVTLHYLRKTIKNKSLDGRDMSMSIWQITLGLALKYMPPGRFVCFVFAVWIWNSLILRSSYQGSLVGFLTQKYYDTSIKNMNGLLDRKFKFYGTNAAMDILKNVTENEAVKRIYKQITLVKTDEEYDRISEKIAKGEIFGTLLHFKTRIPELNFKFQGNGTLVILEETYRSQIITMVFVKFSPLLKAVDQYINRICEAGLVDKWLDDYAWPTVVLEKVPTILQMYHVVGPFLLLLIGEFVSVVIFVVEIFQIRSPLKNKR